MTCCTSFFRRRRFTSSNGALALSGSSAPRSTRPGVVSNRCRPRCPLVDLRDAGLDLGVQVHLAGVERVAHLVDIGEDHAFALHALTLQRDVVEAQDHVLRRNDDRRAVGGRQNVVRRHHQDARLKLGFKRERHVHGHLVAVEVGVEGRADQRVKLDRLAFDQHGLERLDAEAVQRRRAVQQTGCSRITSSRISQTSGRSFSTSFFACFTVEDRPFASSRE
jgi:hypothetical protein